MFKFLLKDKVINTIVERISKEVNSSLETLGDKQEKKMDTMLEHLKQLKLDLAGIDQRLTSKELKDKIEYGQMQYRISALQNDLKQRKPKKAPAEKSH